jgi:hypothetical protein
MIPTYNYRMEGIMLTDEYIAGFFDGEGCIYINPVGRVGVSITQKKPEVLKMISEKYGGSIRLHDRACATFKWEVSSRKEMLFFLKRILPYTVVKTEEIQIGIQAAILIREDNKGSRSLSVEKTNRRQELRQELQNIRPTTKFCNRIASETRKRNRIKKLFEYTCSVCLKDLSGEDAFNQIITKENKLVCRKCNPRSMTPNNLKPITKEEIIKAIESTKNLFAACKSLGICRATLYDKRKKFDLI